MSPLYTRLPLSKIAILLQVDSMSLTMCVDIITILFSAKSDSKLRSLTLSSGSNPAVGSSTIITLGSCKMACAIPNLFFIPPDKLLTFLFL